MNKLKTIFAFLLITAMSGLCFAQTGLVYHEVQVVDENNRPVTSITSVTVRLTGTTTAATIYQDRALNNAITQPITTTSTNTTLSNGSFYWYGPDAWDYTVTDGTNTATNYGHASLTSSSGQIVFPSYLAAISSTTYTDGQTATFGTDSDFVLNGGTTANRFTVTPAATDESAAWWFGADTTGVDVFLFAATSGDYVQWDADDEQLEFVGAAILLDDDSDLIIGSGGDFTIDSDTAATLDIAPLATDESAVINFGSSGVGIVLNMYAATGGDMLYWDAANEELFFEDVKLVLNEGSDLIFEDSGGATDWTIECDSAERLEFLPTETTDDQVVAFGDADHTADLLWYTLTASSIITIDSSEDLMFFDGVDLRINDDDILAFGDSSEFTVTYDETTTDNLIIVAGTANDAVQIGDGTTGTDFICQSSADASAQVQFDASGDTANGVWLFGADDHGIDVTFFGATLSQKVFWDQSADTWYFGADAEGVDVYLYADTTGDYVMWNEDAAAESLTFVDVNAVMDNGSYLLDMGTSGTKALVGTPVLIEFRPTGAETLTWKVPSGVDLLITDAWGHKIAAAGSGANDDINLQNNDGSAANIFDAEELDSVSDKARFAFDNLDDTQSEIEGGDALDCVTQEASSVDCIVYVMGIYKTAD
jgi:hypothetical protein